MGGSLKIDRSQPESCGEDRELSLLIPEDDVENPELSIVIPALNEELMIGRFVDWCKEGLRRAKVRGEVLIIDSSTDATAEVALSKGARVLKSPKRGLGRAYIDAIPFIRGEYVLMGDADCTYDFRQLEQFIERFRGGYEYVMGSRFRGYIEPGSMPWLHEYLGTPVTTWVLNFLYASSFSDIHCGMRGITRDALCKMDLHSQSWEYASEMVLKSVRMGLRTAEVPVRFLKDQEGRLSHHKRAGWFSPWQAAWINLRVMLVNGVDFFVLKPGLTMLGLGLMLTLPLAGGPVTIGPITFSLHWMLAGLALSIIGLQSFYCGCIAQVLYDYSEKSKKKWLGVFRYNRSMVFSGAAFLAGLALIAPLVIEYWKMRFRLPQEALFRLSHLAVMGFLLISAGFINYAFTLLLHATALYVKRKSATSQ
ncbi:MAG TPA: glycosyltransferase family 2 protein [Terriglobia bacterium]|nr:glycosyltransferase family 2 protein [Terriglobia bacterium]